MIWNMSGIFLHHRQLWSMAKHSTERAKQSSRDRPLTLSGEKLIKGKNPYQDFKLLVDVRNSIIHLRPLQRLVPDVGFSQPDPIPKLEKRGLTFKPKWWRDYSWVDAISTVEMAEWSCETARNMIVDIHNRLPHGKDSISYSILADGHLPL